MKSESQKPVAPLAENPLIQLVNYEVIILMDDSRSMLGTRWNQVWDMFLSTVTGFVLIFCVSGGGSYEGTGRRSGQVRSGWYRDRIPEQQEEVGAYQGASMLS